MEQKAQELIFVEPFADCDFRMLYFAMCAFDNSPEERLHLKTRCDLLGEDYDKVLVKLLGFDCHGDIDQYLRKVNDYTMRLAKFWHVAMEEPQVAEARDSAGREVAPCWSASCTTRY